MPRFLPLKPTPAHALLAAALWCAAWCSVALLLALRQPWLGLSLAPQPGSGAVQVQAAAGPAAALPAPAVLAWVAGTGHAPMAPQASDLAEDLDAFDSYAEVDAFVERQRALRSRLAASEVTLGLADAQGAVTAHRLQPAPVRAVSSLPAVFWFQLFTGAAAFMIGAWVLVLRPRELAPRVFAGMGALLSMSVWPAAIYSTRELALDPGLLRILTFFNQAGALGFAAALVALFLSYPKALAPPRRLAGLPVLALLVLAVNQGRWVQSMNAGLRLPIFAALLAALVLAVVQWRATRTDPPARAALRWLGLSTLLGCALFFLLVFAAPALGWLPPLSQGWSFGFFLLMDLGLALGLRRHRLFEIDEWAHRLWLWIGGMVLLLALDTALVLGLHLDPTMSLGLALAIAGLAYLPLRNWLWVKLVARRTLDEQELSAALVDVAFAVTPHERAERWQDVLRQLFHPMELAPAAVAPAGVQIERDGLALLLPATAGAPALRLAYPWQGRGLFGPRHVELAHQIVALMQRADASRDAYDRGAQAERLRIARDLHDDLGARLLSGLSQQRIERVHQSIRDALDDMRGIVDAMAGRAAPWEHLVAELRHETGQRLEAAGLALDWPLPPPDARTLAGRPARHLVSMLREWVSNVIRHAQAGRVSVRLDWHGDGRLTLEVRDDGIGFDVAHADAGNGLSNLRRRVQELGGRIDIASTPQGSRLAIALDAVACDPFLSPTPP